MDFSKGKLKSFGHLGTRNVVGSFMQSVTHIVYDAFMESRRIWVFAKGGQVIGFSAPFTAIRTVSEARRFLTNNWQSLLPYDSKLKSAHTCNWCAVEPYNAAVHNELLADKHAVFCNSNNLTSVTCYLPLSEMLKIESLKEQAALVSRTKAMMSHRRSNITVGDAIDFKAHRDHLISKEKLGVHRHYHPLCITLVSTRTRHLFSVHPLDCRSRAQVAHSVIEAKAISGGANARYHALLHERGIIEHSLVKMTVPLMGHLVMKADGDAFYLREGILNPKKISATTLPRQIAIQQKKMRKQERT